MARGDNLTYEDRARGGRHSHSGGRTASRGRKGGRSSKKEETRAQFEREGESM